MDPPPDPNAVTDGRIRLRGRVGCPAGQRAGARGLRHDLVLADGAPLRGGRARRRRPPQRRAPQHRGRTGFYAFEYEGPAGDLRPVNKNGVTKPMEDLVQRLQFFDADGTLIAEETRRRRDPDPRPCPGSPGSPAHRHAVRLRGAGRGAGDRRRRSTRTRRRPEARPHREGQAPGRLHPEGRPGRRRDAGGPARGQLARDRPHRGRGAAGRGRARPGPAACCPRTSCTTPTRPSAPSR